MSQPIDREGNFRGRIINYALQEFDSGAIAVNLEIEIDEAWDTDSGSWSDWKQYQYVAAGLVFLTKKDGTVNEGAFKSLIENAGWDGTLSSIHNRSWKPTPCGFNTSENTYKDLTTYRIGFINPFDSQPGGGNRSVDSDKLKSLESKFGSKFRAVASTVKRNDTAPAESKPSAPPPRPAKKQEQPQPATSGVGSDSDIPF